MLAFILRRLAQAIFVIVAMLVIVFFGVNVVGDPIYMLISPEMDQQQIAETARALGLDRPIWEQFLVFLKNAAQGDPQFLGLFADKEAVFGIGDDDGWAVALGIGHAL